jgi:hypothetical protein
MLISRVGVVSIIIFASATLITPSMAHAGNFGGKTLPMQSGTGCTATWDQRDAPEIGAQDNVMLSVTGAEPKTLYATGQWYPNQEGGYAPRIVRDVGSGWHDLKLPGFNSNRVFLDHSATQRPGEAWVGGSYLAGQGFEPVLLHVLGDKVSRVGLPRRPADSTELDADFSLPVDVAGDTVWALASYYSSSPSASHVNILYRRTGSSRWTQIHVPGEFVDSLDAVTAREAYIGGDGLYRWLNGALTRVDLSPPSGYVESIAGTGPSSVWVLLNDASGATLQHFDGDTWNRVDFPSSVTTLPDTSVDHMTVGRDGVLWVTGGYADTISDFFRNWTARYDPVTGSWAGGPTSADAPDPEGATGGISDVYASADGNVYIAGWGDDQKEALVAQLCELNVGPAVVTPDTVTVKELGDTLFVAAAANSTGPLSVSDTTGVLTTGDLAANQVVALPARAAGTFELTARPSNLRSTVRVPPLTEKFYRGATVYAGSTPPPAGYAYRLQIIPPNSTNWRTVGLSAASGYTSAIFSNRKWHAGRYQARAQVRNVTSGTTSGWSPVVAFEVPPVSQRGIPRRAPLGRLRGPDRSRPLFHPLP